MEKEEWKPISGYPGYEVSSFGRVRSYKAREGGGAWVIQPSPQRNLKPSQDLGGYLGVNICKDGHPRWTRIHILVCDAFLGPAPQGTEVCHNDGNQENNHLSNLRYDTHTGNQRDRARSRFSEEQVLYIRQQVVNNHVTFKHLSKEFRCNPSTIADICRGWRLQDFPGPLLIDRPQPTSSLTYNDADTIRHRYANGERQVDLAKTYGCSPSYVSHIIHNRRLVRPGSTLLEPKLVRKLTKKQREEIAQRIQAGESRDIVAEEFDISASYTYHLTSPQQQKRRGKGD